MYDYDTSYNTQFYLVCDNPATVPVGIGVIFAGVTDALVKGQ